MKEVHGRVVAVTGASGGVGRAVAREFAKRGDSIALLARGEVGLAATAAEVTVAGATPMVVPVDVADHFQIEEAVARIENELGPIDIWVNSAFTSIFAPFAEIRPEEIKRVTEVTYLGEVYATMAVLRRMRERDAGTIVQVGSTPRTAGFRFRPRTAAQNMHCKVSMSRCAASCCMIKAMSR